MPCVNYYDNTIPSLCVYSTKRVPNEDVDLILDDNFLCGCECEDDCMVSVHIFVCNFRPMIVVFRIKLNASVGK